METSGTVGKDLSDLGLDVTLIAGSSGVLEKLDGLTEVLDGLLVGLLSELVVAFFF